MKVEWTQIREGTLEWFHPHQLDALPLPDTDRRIIWPLVRETESKYQPSVPGSRPGFFTLHIDCSGSGPDGKEVMTWTVDQRM